MRKITQIQSAIALLLGIALLVPVVSIAQPQTAQPQTQSVSSISDRDVDREARRRCKPGTYQRVSKIRKGYLEQGGKIGIPYNLTRGRNYCFVVVGDEQALDVDLEILDRNSRSFRPVVADRTDEPNAFVLFRPKQSGRHNVQVEMYECQDARCEYAVGTYRRG